VLFETGDGSLWGLDGATGARKFRRPKPSPGFEVLPCAGGWLLREGARLSAYDARGRRQYALRLPSGLKGLAVTPEVALYWTEDRLGAYELQRGRRRGELVGVAVKELVASARLGAARLASGAVVVFETGRGLR